MSTDIRARLVWRISLPIIFAQASETILHLIDTIFLARVGVTELGAIAVADSVQLLFLAVPLALVDGIQILAARRAGQRRPDAVGVVFNQGFAMVLGLCIGAAVVLQLVAPLIAGWFVESDAVGGLVHPYLQIASYGIPFNGASFCYSALLVSLGRTQVLVPATLALAATNIGLDYILIFGHFGVPPLGMRGAALGSLGAELVTFGFLTIYVWRRFGSRYGLFHFGRFQARTTRVLNGISAPIAAGRLLETFRWLVFFLILEHVSEEALAVANIVFTCYIVFWIPTEGFADTAVSIVSRLVGRDQADRIGNVLRHAIGGALLATVPFIAIALLAPGWFLAAFNPGADLLLQGSASLRVIGIAMLIVIPGEMWFAAVSGTGDTAAALGIEVVLTLTMLSLAYIIAIQLGWPLELIWISVPISWLICLTISYMWVKSGIWKRLEVH